MPTARRLIDLPWESLETRFHEIQPSSQDQDDRDVSDDRGQELHLERRFGVLVVKNSLCEQGPGPTAELTEGK